MLNARGAYPVEFSLIRLAVPDGRGFPQGPYIRIRGAPEQPCASALLPRSAHRASIIVMIVPWRRLEASRGPCKGPLCVSTFRVRATHLTNVRNGWKADIPSI